MEVFAHFDIINSSGVKVAEGHKASFCLEDNQCTHNTEPVYKCANYGDQGISVNCTDTYHHNIDCQWIDITDIDPGIYTFKVQGPLQFLFLIIAIAVHYSLPWFEGFILIWLKVESHETSGCDMWTSYTLKWSVFWLSVGAYKDSGLNSKALQYIRKSCCWIDGRFIFSVASSPFLIWERTDKETRFRHPFAPARRARR